MLHILLLILKIIGIIILVLLGLILLILLLPITYSGKFKIENTKVSYNIKIGWLFYFISFHINNRKKWIQLFGIRIKEIKKTSDEKKTSKKNKKEIKNEKIKKKSEEDQKKKTEKQKIDEKKEQKNFNKEKDSVLEQTKEKTEKKHFAKIKNIYNKIKTKAKEFWDNTQSGIDKIKEYKKIITAKTTKRAYNYGKKITIKLLKHIKPRKIRANISFGMKEPDQTGKTLGYLGMTFATLKINPKKIKINPDFNRKLLKGNAEIRGHFILGLVLIYCLKFYFNKDIHQTIKKFKREA